MDKRLPSAHTGDMTKRHQGQVKTSTCVMGHISRCSSLSSAELQGKLAAEQLELSLSKAGSTCTASTTFGGAMTILAGKSEPFLLMLCHCAWSGSLPSPLNAALLVASAWTGGWPMSCTSSVNAELVKGIAGSLEASAKALVANSSGCVLGSS